jgi:hypothetical protein
MLLLVQKFHWEDRPVSSLRPILNAVNISLFLVLGSGLMRPRNIFEFLLQRIKEAILAHRLIHRLVPANNMIHQRGMEP